MTWQEIKLWWREWGLLVQGVGLLLVAFVLTAVILVYVSDQKASTVTARTACERTRKFGPGIVDFFEREKALSPSALAEYRASIPKTCD